MADILEDADLFPASFAQQRLWFLDQLIAEKALYNNLFALRMQGQLHVPVLTRTMQEIVDRHETLRTSFLMEEEAEELLQVILPELTLSLEQVDLQTLPVAVREAHAMEIAAREARAPFDLAQGPLFRTSLLRLSETEHVLLFTIHHIISDGWSLGVLTQELVMLYQAFLAEQPSPLEELPIQYADFAAFQQDWLQGDVLAEQLGYWKEQLAGELPVLQLPSDRPRSAVISYRGGKQSFTLSKKLTERLHELSRTQGVTLFMTLLAAYQTLLARYSGQEDILVGSPIAGRNRAEIEGLIGFFVNTLVLRTNVANAPTFADLLQQVKEVTLDAYAHQDVPFEKLVEELQPERSQSHTPLFQVMFVLQNAPQSTLELPELTLSVLDVETGTSKFDLLLSMHETAKGLTGSLEYSTDLFEKETISRMLTHWEQLLESVVEFPHRSVTRLQLMNETEVAQLQKWSRAETVEQQTACVHHLFEQQAAETPDRVALVFEEQQMTYAELNGRANQVAHYLQEQGVGPDTPVGLCVERSIELVVGMLGILKAGGAYVSLDPAYPHERLAYMREEAKLSVVVTQESLRGIFLPSSGEQPSITTVALDGEEERLAHFSNENVATDVTSDHLAYLLFTSGSTGRPKGVAMEHRPLVHLLLWQIEHFTTAREAKVMQFASPNFDVSFQEIFSTLCAGGTLCIPSEAVRKDGERLLDFLTEWKVERIFLPYIVLQHLAEVAANRRGEPLAVREIITAGEQLQMTRSIVQWLEEMPGCVLHNQYGPTESHVVTAHALTGQPHTWQKLPSIGRPLPHAEVWVLDTHMQMVPIGVPGELYIGGQSLARGYWERPELTSERFVPHPFSANQADRLYKTGDLVRFMPDGTLDYLGRIDGQVKVRGFRIELGEIETVLATHPSVRECTVIVREDVPGDKRLVAYVVEEQVVAQATDETGEYRRWLQTRLPDYMVPTAFVKLAQLPVTPNGKVDRRALPAPVASERRHQQAPQTEQEQQVAQIWADVLRVEGIDRLDNFFDIGGHSLLAAQVMTRMSQAFGFTIPLRLLFEHATVAELAKQVQQLQETHREEKMTSLRKVPIEKRGVLSFAQERGWAAHHGVSDSAALNMPCILRMKGNLRIEALERALQEIIRRHEILRTSYLEREGTVQQVLHPFQYRSLQVIDLSDLSPLQQEEEVAQRTLEDAKQAFSLGEVPMIRSFLLRLSETEHVLSVNVHHIAFDGWSISVLVKELTALYNAYASGKHSPLEELPIQYGEYASWQREREKSGVWERQLAYWKQRLAGPRPSVQLPADHHPTVRTSRGASVSFTFSQPVAERIQQLCRGEGVTLYMLFLAAMQTMLYRYTGTSDQRIATPVANRSLAELEKMIGYFTNNVVLRNQLLDTHSFSDLLQQTRTFVLDAFANAEVPFPKVAEALRSETSGSEPPLFQAMVLVQNTPDATLELPELTISMQGIDNGTTKFELLLAIEEAADGMIGSFVYSTDLFAERTIHQMVSDLQRLLEQVIEQPTCKLIDIDIRENQTKQSNAK